MTKMPCRAQSPEFNAKMAIAELEGNNALAKLVQEIDINPNQITQWTVQLPEGTYGVFGASSVMELLVMTVAAGAENDDAVLPAREPRQQQPCRDGYDPNAYAVPYYDIEWVAERAGEHEFERAPPRRR